MLIYIGDISDKYYYGVYNIIKMLYPLCVITRNALDKADLSFEFEIDEKSVTVFANGVPLKREIMLDDVSLTLKRCIYEFSGYTLPFGVFTGIRPVKAFNRYGKEAFENVFLVDKEKALVTEKCAVHEKKLSESIPQKSTALYVNIPFCPSVCAYCSFTAARYSEVLVKDYFEALMYELTAVLRTMKESEIKLLCVYVGGGTPTVLSPKMLDTLCSEIRRYFPFVSEFTVEAGRADTITEDKLRILKRNGVSRISINPQTLNNSTLARIGRHHTAEDFFTAFETAKKFGFTQINTDIIAGLFGESFSDFKYTADEILKLSPQSITVHTLCKKRCADMEDTEILGSEDVKKMLNYTYNILENNYSPYYIYRQKNAAGALENVGFVNDDEICAYNIIMMEEIASVTAVGAGSASKLIDFETKKPFMKLRNDKQPQRYISDIKEITEKKRRFLENETDKI